MKKKISISYLEMCNQPDYNRFHDINENFIYIIQMKKKYEIIKMKHILIWRYYLF